MDITSLNISLDEIAHDIDMIVFRLETKPPTENIELLREREHLKKELEQFRDRLKDLARMDQAV